MTPFRHRLISDRGRSSSDKQDLGSPCDGVRGGRACHGRRRPLAAAVRRVCALLCAGEGVPVPRSGGVSDRGRISAIVADAHSGKYFSNKFEDSYPKAAEIGMMKGMIRATDDDPTMSDALLACSLSYIETHVSFMELVTDPRSAKKIGVKAGFACLDHMNL
jgi:hypothetical protein